MERPAWKFVDGTYDEEAVKTIINGLQETGPALLPNLFQHDTIDPFLTRARSAPQKDLETCVDGAQKLQRKTLKQIHAAVYDDGVEAIKGVKNGLAA